MKIAFLTYEDILEIHDYQIRMFGGDDGIYEDGRIVQSALAAPINAYEYGEEDVFELAAAYAWFIVNGHGFVDGNKRTGLQAAIVFLDRHGYDWPEPAADFERQILDVASSLMTRHELAEELRAVYFPADE